MSDKMNIKTFIIALVGGFVGLTACNNDKTTPGYTFMDDMYVGPALETYDQSDNFDNGLAAQKPVEGTVPRDYVVYEYPNTNEGYEAARTTLSLPEEFKGEGAVAKGKELYTIFCAPCHGDKGDGNGWLVEQEKILGVPSYSPDRLPDITAGSMYHVIMHGKGIMGSHASQLTYDERWNIIRYVLELRGEKVEMASDAEGEMEVENNEQQS
jgi:mono/diheme cytochrome c family protein